MKNIQNKIVLFCTVLLLVILLNACGSAEGNETGHEYMPDMYHSIAYEANSYNYYYFNTWGPKDEYYRFAQPRLPVPGTVARGYTGVNFASDPQAAKEMVERLRGQSSRMGIAVPVNGNVPYHYGNTEEERTRATAEIIQNPYPITTAGLARAKNLYDIYCGICHGEKGDGNGYLYNDELNPNAKYPAAPANLLTDEFITASNGRYYHAIMYGKNVMGPYADKLSFEERWQVIHYIRSLQAKEKKLIYDETANTLNDVEVPGIKLMPLASDDLGNVPEQIEDPDEGKPGMDMQGNPLEKKDPQEGNDGDENRDE